MRCGEALKDSVEATVQSRRGVTCGIGRTAPLSCRRRSLRTSAYALLPNSDLTDAETSFNGATHLLRPRTPEFRVPHAQSGAITPEPLRGFERGANAPSRRGRIRVQVCFANSAAEQRPWIHLRISKLRKKEVGSRK